MRTPVQLIFSIANVGDSGRSKLSTQDRGHIVVECLHRSVVFLIELGLKLVESVVEVASTIESNAKLVGIQDLEVNYLRLCSDQDRLQ